MQLFLPLLLFLLDLVHSDLAVVLGNLHPLLLLYLLVLLLFFFLLLLNHVFVKFVFLQWNEVSLKLNVLQAFIDFLLQLYFLLVLSLDELLPLIQRIIQIFSI